MSSAHRVRNDAAVVSPHSVLDDATFAALYQRLERPLYNAAYRYVWNAEDARDVVQEAFMKVWDARARLDPQIVEPYLWRTVFNTASHRRRWARLRSFTGLDALVSSKRAPDDELIRRGEDLRVRAAVDALPEAFRQVVLLSEIARMTHEEIARVLQVAPGTVASRRARAFEKLRAVLGDLAVVHEQKGPADAAVR